MCENYKDHIHLKYCGETLQKIVIDIHVYTVYIFPFLVLSMPYRLFSPRTGNGAGNPLNHKTLPILWGFFSLTHFINCCIWCFHTLDFGGVQMCGQMRDSIFARHISQFALLIKLNQDHDKEAVGIVSGD